MTTTNNNSKTISILSWIAQLLLAITFLWGGAMKLFVDAQKLAEMWPWTVGNETLVKITGIIDLLAGIGIILPSILKIQPKLVVLTAFGACALMLAASIFHISRGEVSSIGINIFILVLTLFVIWGKQK